MPVPPTTTQGGVRGPTYHFWYRPSTGFARSTSRTPPDTLCEDDQNRDLRPGESHCAVRFLTWLSGYGEDVLVRSGGYPKAHRVHGPSAPLRVRAGTAGAVRRAALRDARSAYGVR